MKKNRAKRFWALLLALSLTAVSATMPVKADSAGTPIPGIDVYQGQKTIDWSAVKNSGIQFAMIRDGFGGDPGSWDNQKDDYFEQNYAGATAAGIKVGAYHYSYATSVQDASNEADECLHILNGRHLDYPVAYDVEESRQSGLSSDTLGEMVQTFCSKLQQAGYKVAVYSFKNFYLSHLNSPLVSQYDTWIAQFGVSAPNFSPYTMWQYSSSGSVPGISGACDMDYSYVDYANGGGSTPTTLDPLDFKCDTPAYTFSSNRHYIYKITTPDTYPPTAQSSNPSAVTVSGPTSTYNGYLFTLTNVGAGDATITTTAGDGRSVSFKATGSGTASALRCDTSSYTFGPSRNVYYYKITTDASSAPSASSSNTSAVTVAYSSKTSGGYLYKITNVGAGTATITTTAADGSTISFPATGRGATKAPMGCDTSSYTFGPDRNVYYYKITTDASSAPSASSSNTSAVTVAYSSKTSGGYLYKITNVGAGTATITTTAADGSTVSFPATGRGATKAPMGCDTSSYTFGPGRYTYIYKITTNASTAPVAASSDTSVATVAYSSRTSGGYLYKITNVGAGTAAITTTAADGSSVSFQATGVKQANALDALQSDTPYNYSMKKGAYYTYKFTGTPGTSYKFVCAATNVIRSVSLSKLNGSYYLKIYAMGKGQAGIYVTGGGQSRRAGIVTVS